MINKIKKIVSIKMYILVYFVVNLVFLTKFPFMHSDESWLSGLSRNMFQQKSLSVTETFFDLMPRYPHAIKSIFHILQIQFMKVFGYELFAFRLISLIFGVMALYVFYKIINKLYNKKTALITTIILSLDIQFIYGAHFARQEIILVFIQLLALFVVIKFKKTWTIKNSILLACILGLGIGIHPNSFIISIPLGMILFWEIINRKITIKNLLIFVGVLGIIAIGFVLLSYSFDSQFITHYRQFGDPLGVNNAAGNKVSQIKNYYLKLYYGISGTYYTPNIKFQLISLFLSVVAGFLISIKYKQSKVIYPLLGIIGINIGYIIVGRYGQPSIIFIFPYIYLLIISLIDLLKSNKNILILICILSITTINSVISIVLFINNDYEKYIKDISDHINSDAIVLANLNTEYYFDNNALYDYRNLDYLYNKNMTFTEYIQKNNIEYIVYPEEMDYIYNHRPVWNIIYGNLYPYYEEMNDFLQNECDLIYKFYSPYGMRIVKYMYQKDWEVRIYKIKDN